MIKVYTTTFLLTSLTTASITACVHNNNMGSSVSYEGDAPPNVYNIKSLGIRKNSEPIFGKTGQKVIGLNVEEVTALYDSMKPGDLWPLLRANFQLPHNENNPIVQAQIRWFVNHPTYLKTAAGQAAPYIYYVYDQVKARHLPAELILLPIIESSYNPLARNSASGATGLWQLMPRTAQGYGVVQNRWFDGRRDVYASTDAALDYLSYLKNFFSKNWLLAIAAYNTGEGNVQNSVRHNAKFNLPTDFWHLSLPEETRAYIPRLLALACIIENPKKYGITLPLISDQPYVTQIKVNSPITLLQAAALANLSIKDLKQLNPAFTNSEILLRKPYNLILPMDRVALFKQKLAHVLKEKIHTDHRHLSQKKSLNRVRKNYKKIQ